MSVNYYAYAVIGCEVPVEKLYEDFAVLHKAHPAPPDAVFCPTCGKPMREWRRRPIFNDEYDTLNGITIWWGTDHERAVVGYGASTRPTQRKDIAHIDIDTNRIDEFRRELKEKLSLLDLWDESKFGLYAISYCSY